LPFDQGAALSKVHCAIAEEGLLPFLENGANCN